MLRLSQLKHVSILCRESVYNTTITVIGGSLLGPVLHQLMAGERRETQEVREETNNSGDLQKENQ